MEELRRSAASWAPGSAGGTGVGQLDEGLLEKKLGKLRKKYEKKIQAMKAETEDLKEVRVCGRYVYVCLC